MEHADSEREGKDGDVEILGISDNIYKPLENPDQEIRIVNLLPGEYDDPIVCMLEVRPLDYEIPYDALSYTWDDALQNESIILLHNRTGKEHKITKNLEIALRHIRDTQAPGPIYLWIDSLSINQADLHEKNQQIRLMREIYQNARNVVVWLGDEDEDTVTAFHFITQLSENKHLSELTIHTTHDLWDVKDRSLTMNSMVEMVNRAWWKRMWTTQEIILAKSPMVVCGFHIIEWDDIVKAATFSRKHHLTCCALVDRNSKGLGPGGFIESFREPVNHLENYRTLRQQSISTDILELLGGFANRATTDPRDKLYGLLGLASGVCADSIEVNYDLPVEEVYRRSIIHIIKASESLDVFAYVNSVKPNPTLPAWVPDWRSLTGTAVDASLYKASKGTRAQIHELGSEKLQVKGYAIDTISESGVTIKDEVPEYPGMVDLMSILKAIRSWARMCDFFQDPKRNYIGGGTLDNAFWRTLRNDCVRVDGIHSSYRRTEEGDHVSWEEWAGLLEGEYEGEARLKELMDQLAIDPHVGISTKLGKTTLVVVKSTHNSRLCITRGGYIGLVPNETRVGDQLCVLLGGKVPYILRPVIEESSISSDNDPQTSCHSFIGGCYIDGLMDGEAMDSPEKEEVELQDFVLI